MHAMNGLTHQQIVDLKRQLERQESTARAAMHGESIARNLSGEGSIAQYHGTTDDEAIVDVLNDASIADVVRHTASLGAIEHSLEAIVDNTYGKCEGCGRHIGVKRLSANLTATHCIHCQTKREKGNVHASL